MMRTGVALGSNFGDRRENLRAARGAIVDLSEVSPPILASALYETAPVACEPGAENFLNAVMEFNYDGDPAELLLQLQRIEQSLGRALNHEQNRSRTIDLDLLYFGDYEIDNERLRLPHPRMHLRGFVLAPLADVRPDLILPNQTKTVSELLAQLGEPDKVVRLTKDW